MRAHKTISLDITVMLLVGKCADLIAGIETARRKPAHVSEGNPTAPFLDRKAVLACLLRDAKADTLLNEHIAEDEATVFAHACRLGAEGIVSKRVDAITQKFKKREAPQP
jgi:hypothetical protein